MNTATDIDDEDFEDDKYDGYDDYEYVQDDYDDEVRAQFIPAVSVRIDSRDLKTHNAKTS